ncbi:hypothetical protein [Thermus tenuipuniceus]|uniref:hypothetical protein n=1 Tax=Thermus tenuipuniceus TaxID=2078690 RepID=UPI000CFA4CA9|nr:hypothetical protein [Thermus tenuipuniceus]
MKLAHQFLAEVRLTLIAARVYLPNQLAGLFADAVFFYAIWMALTSLSPSDTRPHIGHGGNILLMYAAFNSVVGTFQALAFAISQEADRGTLEHLALARGGLLIQLVLRGFSDTLFNLFRTAILIGVLALITGIPLNPQAFWPVAISLLALGALGFSLTMAALALYFKRILSFFMIIQFGLLLYFFSVANWQGHMVYLPLAPAAHLLSQSLTGGVWKGEVALFALAQSLLLLGTGFLALSFMYRLVRLRGLLGRY